MLPVETIALFLAAAITLAIAPGPDNIFVVTHAALHGRIAGLVITLGLCTGLIVHTTAVALGVAVIFQTSEIAFTSLKIFGACYLTYLAWQAYRATSSKLQIGLQPRHNLRKLYVKGVVMNITNPKVAIFFLAFLPQFTDPNVGSVSFQICVLGMLFMLSTLIVFGIVAWSAGFLSGWLRSTNLGQRVMNKVAAAIFLGLALKIVTAER